MKKIFFSLIFVLLLSACNTWDKVTWQGAYYDGWTDDSNIIYWPMFTNYEWCKDWAISKSTDAYNNYSYCSKNCNNSIGGTPICEEVVRSWQPLPWSNTFSNYKE